MKVTNTDLYQQYSQAWKSNTPSSQRYLLEQDNDDIEVPEITRRNITKKFSEIISQQVEFYQVPDVDEVQVKKVKNRLKLLKDADCYVQPYTEAEFACKIPQRRPEFTRRKIDKEDDEQSQMERIRSAAVTAESIMRGDEIKLWAKKPERPNKIFHYKTNKKNIANLQEPINEFTKLRNKNQWHESKIKKKEIYK